MMSASSFLSSGAKLGRWLIGLAIALLGFAALVSSADAAEAQLTVADGVVVKFGVSGMEAQPGAGLLVRDQIRTGARVVFTSARDDESGGLLRTTPSFPASGDWLGLFIAGSVKPSQLSINGLKVRYAGGNAPAPSYLVHMGAALVLPGAAYSISNLHVERSAVGLRIAGTGSPQIRASQIVGNQTGVEVLDGATPTIQESSLADNVQYGVINRTPQSIVQAAQNWWGHITGPYDPTGNPSGSGSRVSEGVVYQPYLGTDPAAPPGPALSVSFSGQSLVPNASLQSAGEMLLSAHSASGVSRLEAYIDNRRVLDQSFGNPSPSTEAAPITAREFLRFENVANGSHTLLAVARDAVGGVTNVSAPFTLDLQPPAAPTISSPVTGASTATPYIGVSGSAQPGSNVQIYVNGQATGSAVLADSSGSFSSSVQLPGDGTHSLQAQASNVRGAGPLSASVGITLALPLPTVSFVSPAEQAVLRGTVPVQVSAIDASGIAKVELRAEGTAGSIALGRLTSAPWGVDWNTSTLPDGTYTLVAVATGRAGKSAQVTRQVRLEQVPPPPPPPPLPYATQGVTATPALSFGDQTIVISGEAVTRDAPSQPAANATLRLVLRVQGFERRITLVSDPSGRFSYSFVPQSNDAGTYAVYVVHPEDSTYAARPAHAQFTINRLSFNYNRFTLNAIRGQSTPFEVQARASAGTGWTGVRWQALAADQPAGALPPGITLEVGQPVDVPAGTSVPMTLRFTGSAGAGATGTIILKAFANESAGQPRAELRLDYQLHEATPGLTPSPSLVEIGVKQGESASAVVTVTNKGLAAARNARAQLLTTQGAAPPAWIRLVSGGDIGNIDVGQAVPLQIMAQPGAEIADGYYQYQLKINADNDGGGAVPVTVAVAQSGEGGVRFKMVDIYTNTLDKAGQPIPGLGGATIKLQNEALTADIRTLVSDDQGNAELAKLPPGNYRWRASAPQHTDASGRIQVRAALTANERVFLDSQLISVEFNVTETTIKDEYNITLEATYQTQVPAPVVLLEPMNINLPDMQVGEEVSGEVTLSNYGLVRADDLAFTLPGSDAFYRYEFFGELPTQLAAKSRVMIPYRITALAPVKRSTLTGSTNRVLLTRSYSPSLEAQNAIRNFLATGNGAGGLAAKSALVAKATSCTSYQLSLCTAFAYECAGGDVRTGLACTGFSRLSGASCSASSVISGGGNGVPGSGGGSGGWGSGGTALPPLFTPLASCPPGGCSRCAKGGKGSGGAGGGRGAGGGAGSGGNGNLGPGPIRAGTGPNFGGTGGTSGTGGTGGDGSGGDSGDKGDGPPDDKCQN